MIASAQLAQNQILKSQGPPALSERHPTDLQSKSPGSSGLGPRGRRCPILGLPRLIREPLSGPASLAPIGQAASRRALKTREAEFVRRMEPRGPAAHAREIPASALLEAGSAGRLALPTASGAERATRGSFPRGQVGAGVDTRVAVVGGAWAARSTPVAAAARGQRTPPRGSVSGEGGPRCCRCPAGAR